MTLLPDKLFVRLMIGTESQEDQKLTREEKANVIKDYHNSPTAGHPDVKKMMDLLQRRGFKWKGIRQDMKKYVRGCLICQKVKPKIGPRSD
jgi:hypothetical protein